MSIHETLAGEWMKSRSCVFSASRPENGIARAEKGSQETAGSVAGTIRMGSSMPSDLQERTCSLLRRPSPCQQHVFRKAGIIAVDKLAAGLATPDRVANPRSLCLTQVRIETGASRRRGCDMCSHAQVDGVLLSR